MLKERGWGIDRVKQHYNWSKKNCPHRIRNEKRWDGFLNRVKIEMNKKEVKEVENVKNEKVIFPSSNTFKNEWVAFLEKAHKKGFLDSRTWVEKAKNGTLTEGDASSLIATIINRSGFLDQK